ncbi:MAG: FAD-binding protein [Micavibrio sp.]|nr:MAG: FAD-binding protein [Micavibrio sp.]
MTDKKNIDADLCVIGAGAGGLSVAAGAVQLGLKTVLIEKGEMGGDCLNTGCVPSKALLAAGAAAQAQRSVSVQGIAAHKPDIDFAAVKDHVAGAIAAIAPHDSQERFENLGMTVLRDVARFTGKNTVVAGNITVTARYFVIATGSRASVPPIEGLDKEKALTNETIFDLKEKPDHLLIVGGGPIGIEMAQAHLRLGCKVSVFDMGAILPRDDEKCVNILRQALLKEGAALYEKISIKNISHQNGGVSVTIENSKGKEEKIGGDRLLVAAGRVPQTDGLDLEKAGVTYDRTGIKTDARLRTENKRIFAVGDVVAGAPQFTHVAGYHAGIIIRNICFKIPVKTDYAALPWVTYTAPELAQAGLTEQAAREKHGDDMRIAEWPLKDNDRAVTENKTEGLVRIVTLKNGRILGASIVAPHAGEMIAAWALAIAQKMKIGAVAGAIFPYPTYGEAGKRAAGAWFSEKLFSDKTRKLVGFLQKLPF